MRVLITGSNGFIGKNLRVHLSERKDLTVLLFTRESNPRHLAEMVLDSDFVFHFAGVNRPKDEKEFEMGNITITGQVCDAIAAAYRKSGKTIPILYTSSTQANRNNPYGVSKKAAEEMIFSLKKNLNLPVFVFRLPNVFGKWSVPNYNSAVATFCHNISRGIAINVHDPKSVIDLVYVDDVIRSFINLMDGSKSLANDEGFELIEPTYSITVAELAGLLHKFKGSRNSIITERVGSGLVRALYATYLSFLPKELFTYKVQQYPDQRGNFIEMLKTKDSGQFSFFTAKPGVTRGGHYHHTKSEKFLIIQGSARYRFKNLVTGEYYEIETSGKDSEIIETVPGWTHDITNIGDDELIVMLWANEIFDRSNPDTVNCPILND